MADKPYITKIAGVEYTIEAEERERLDRYAQTGKLPIDPFLAAILKNDFVDAVFRTTRPGDDKLRNLPAFAHYLIWEMPAESWGSMEKVMEWWTVGGLRGKKKHSKGEKAC